MKLLGESLLGESLLGDDCRFPATSKLRKLDKSHVGFHVIRSDFLLTLTAFNRREFQFQFYLKMTLSRSEIHQLRSDSSVRTLPLKQHKDWSS